jgi:hypothetical protein
MKTSIKMATAKHIDDVQKVRYKHNKPNTIGDITLLLSSVTQKWPPYIVWKCSDITASFCLLRGSTVKQFELLVKKFLYAPIQRESCVKSVFKFRFDGRRFNSVYH